MRSISPGDRWPSGRGAVAWMAASVLAAGGLALVGGAQQALAAGSPPSCTDGTCTVTFASTGKGQTFTVPAGTTSLSVSLYGAVGGPSQASPGGDGALVTAMLAVTSGSTLGVDVGGAGSGSEANDTGSPGVGGVNGGGGSGAEFSDSQGGGGGGATDVTVAGTRVLVAGGGGGAGDLGFIDTSCAGATFAYPAAGVGGNADTPGGNGTSAVLGTRTVGAGAGGAAGTTTAGRGGGGGGLSGSDPCSSNETTGGATGGSGSGGTGGTSTPSPEEEDNAEGGGGGGGYLGGGAGGDGAFEHTSSGSALGAGGGGGGGSSYADGSGVSAANVNDEGNADSGGGQVNSGNGEVVFQYTDPVSVGTPAAYADTVGQTLSVASASGLLATASAPAGDTLTASGSGASTQGGTVVVNSDGSFSYTPPSATFTGTDTFSFTVTDASGADATGTATVQVTGAPPVFAQDAPSLSLAGGSSYTYQFIAVGSPTPTYSLGVGAPSWLTIDPNSGQLTGTPPAGTTSFTYTVLAANAAAPNGVAAGPFTVSVTLLPQAISFTAPATGIVGESAPLTATGGGSGNAVVFTVDPQSGAGVCSVTGDTVTYTAAGTCLIDATQAGNGEYAGAQPVQGTINVEGAPVFTHDSPPLTAATGTPYSYQFAASGTPSPAYSLGAGAPSWLTINPTTGQVSGTPPVGTRSFSYRVLATSPAAPNGVAAGPFKVTVSDEADIQAALSCPSGLTLGQSATCRLTVTNAGPALADHVVAGAFVPPPLRVTGCSNPCWRIGGAVGWTLGSLPAGQSDTLTISVTAAGPGFVRVTALDGSANPDPRLLNNLAAATVKITR